MIDVGKLKAAIGEGPGNQVIGADFDRDYLNQVVTELVAGREALEELDRLRERAGQCFGLKRDDRL